MKKFLLLIICIIMIFSVTSCAKVKRIEPLVYGFSNCNIDNYEKKRTDIEYARDLMPALDELGRYTELGYSHQHTTMPFFETDVLALYIEYPIELYSEKKANILSSYVFLEETMISTNGEDYLSAPAEFDYRAYHFQTVVNLNVANSEGSACKSFVFIGFNDENGRIAYCYFYDFDLDAMGSTQKSEQEMIIDFMDDYFYWNDIK